MQSAACTGRTTTRLESFRFVPLGRDFMGRIFVVVYTHQAESLRANRIALRSVGQQRRADVGRAADSRHVTILRMTLRNNPENSAVSWLARGKWEKATCRELADVYLDCAPFRAPRALVC